MTVLVINVLENASTFVYYITTFLRFSVSPVTLNEGHLTLHALKGLAQNTNVPPFIPAVMTESMEKMQTFEFFEVSYQPLRQ